MKSQGEIYQKIRKLEDDITEFKNIINNSTEWDVKNDYNKLIVEAEKRIELLKWVLEE